MRPEPAVRPQIKRDDWREKCKDGEWNSMEQVRELKKGPLTVRIRDDGTGKVKPVLWLPVSGKEERALTDVWGKSRWPLCADYSDRL